MSSLSFKLFRNEVTRGGACKANHRSASRASDEDDNKRRMTVTKSIEPRTASVRYEVHLYSSASGDQMHSLYNQGLLTG